jgi:hypothetical protein
MKTASTSAEKIKNVFSIGGEQTQKFSFLTSFTVKYIRIMLLDSAFARLFLQH